LVPSAGVSQSTPYDGTKKALFSVLVDELRTWSSYAGVHSFNKRWYVCLSLDLDNTAK